MGEGLTATMEATGTGRETGSEASSARVDEYFKARRAELDRARTPYGQAMDSIKYLRTNLWRHYPEERGRALIDPEKRDGGQNEDN